ncbi:MAG: 4Fe-4S dicluster domain-containing protein [Dehalococcoidia bacterium]|nr:4Fe-4S dicluster domain-containing protein [Dehalococcoidia bacterium]
MNKISRRLFLKTAGATVGCLGLATALGSTKVFAAEGVFYGHPDRKGMLIDTTTCIGCRSCEAACNQINNLPTPEAPFSDRAVFNEKRRTTATAFTVVNQYNSTPDGPPIYRKQQCMHCEEPTCVSVCLVAAMKKTAEGPVTYNQDVCMGCRYCIAACPFYQPTYEYDNATTPRVRKCEMCFKNRVQQGGIPACAEACPTKSIIFGKRSDLLALGSQRIVNKPDKYVNYIYGEHEAGGTGMLYLASVPFDQLGLPTNLSRTPYPELTRDFLAAVPLVLIGWPALFLGANAFAKSREQETLSEETPTEDS